MNGTCFFLIYIIYTVKLLSSISDIYYVHVWSSKAMIK